MPASVQSENQCFQNPAYFTEGMETIIICQLDTLWVNCRESDPSRLGQMTWPIKKWFLNISITIGKKFIKSISFKKNLPVRVQIWNYWRPPRGKIK